MDKIFDNEDELVKKCPTCGSEITGISEVFDANGKKISTDYQYEDSNTNEKEHKFALKEEKEEQLERFKKREQEERENLERVSKEAIEEEKYLANEKAMADWAESFKNKD